MHDERGSSTEPMAVSIRTMDIVAALLFLLVSAIVLYDSARLGFRWQESSGPAPGYFPFYIALIMGAASLVNLARALFFESEGAVQAFVTKPALRRVLTVLGPLAAYVGMIVFVGMYVASALFITLFMIFFGGYKVLKAGAVGLGFVVVLFFMFEKCFLVPLPQCERQFCYKIVDVLDEWGLLPQLKCEPPGFVVNIVRRLFR
ncbi:MAG: tripartite tricarboxylate transporter TctB family protein [Hyphomicrobiaceae bacterium]